MINIAICDDENSVINDIEKLLFDKDSIEKIEVDIYYGGNELAEKIEQGKQYDLIYLDIEMGKENGIKIAHRIRKIDRNLIIIFVTSHIGFAREAFEVNAFRFLSKPIDVNKFNKYYQDAIDQIFNKNIFFRYKNNKENLKIEFSKIIYFQSDYRKTFIITKDDILRCTGKLNEIEKTLESRQIYFYRISQSLLVNPKYVYSYQKTCITLNDGTNFHIPENRRNKVNKLFCKLKCSDLID